MAARPSAAVAQSTVMVWFSQDDDLGDDDLGDDDLGDEEFEEDDDEDAEVDEISRELRGWRRDLLETIEHLEEEIDEAEENDETGWAEFLRTRLAHRRSLVGLVENAQEIVEKWRAAIEDERDERANELGGQLEEAFWELEKAEFVGEVEGLLAELGLLAQELAEDGNSEAQRRFIDTLIKDQRRVLELVTRAQELGEQERWREAEELEYEIEQLNESVHLRFEAFEIEREVVHLQEEGEVDEAAELLDELGELIEELHEFDIEYPRSDLVAEAGEMESTTEESYVPPKVQTNETQFANVDFESEVLPVLKRYCFDCHGNTDQEADLNLESMLTITPLVRERLRWNRVAQHTLTAVMPPDGADQPSNDERVKIVAWLDEAVTRFDYRTVQHPGQGPARRLSHHEFNHTIRDLFGVDIRPADSFPEESSGSSGFDNSANTLFMQPLLVERYFAASEQVMDAVLPRTNSPSPLIRSLLSELQTAGSQIEEIEIARTRTFPSFLLQAFRRPATQDELERWTDFYEVRRQRGLTIRESLKETLGVILVSPKFLMRVESPLTNESEVKVSDWEIASRLSYFLWASMPDERLFDLAAEGKLSDARVVSAEIDRMLADPRAESLGNIFAAQWLGYQHLGTRVRLDPIDNPWCTDTLMDAMRAESSMFFVSLIRENQPLAQLIEADYTYLNEELARHYRIDDIEGTEMRRVQLETDRRGGIFGQGSVLAVTSFPDRTSPVNRGKWILSDVLGTPPPPPPPNVSEFDERIEENERLTLRRKLELHRSQPSCAACHNQIDPLGLSLEHYDKFGRWRTRAESGRVDARGELPNGTKFSGLSGLKQVIVDQRMDDLSHQIARKMLAYALGRQLEYYDEATVNEIVQQIRSDNFRMADLVHAVIESYPFQYRARVADQ